MSKKTFIYGLYSDSDGIIRYVGKSDDPEHRLKRHIYQKDESKTHKNYWIKKAIKENQKICYKILECVDFDIWQEREKHWISQFDNLVNTAKGGLGGCGIKYEIEYEDCKKWISENIQTRSKSEWYSMVDYIPDFIPKNPRETYLNRGWISWGDFLGTNNIQDNIRVLYLSYSDAKKWVREEQISIENSKLWKSIDLPSFLPRRPERYYRKKGWISWSDFLGNERVQNQKKIFLKYEDCIKWLQENYRDKIKNHSDWKSIRKEFPEYIPSNPNIHYLKKGWISWQNFLLSIQ